MNRVYSVATQNTHLINIAVKHTVLDHEFMFTYPVLRLGDVVKENTTLGQGWCVRWDDGRLEMYPNVPGFGTAIGARVAYEIEMKKARSRAIKQLNRYSIKMRDTSLNKVMPILLSQQCHICGKKECHYACVWCAEWVCKGCFFPWANGVSCMKCKGKCEDEMIIPKHYREESKDAEA